MMGDQISGQSIRKVGPHPEEDDSGVDEYGDPGDEGFEKSLWRASKPNVRDSWRDRDWD